MCSQKECPTKFETRWLQEIPFSKELTDNYCALGLQLRAKLVIIIIIIGYLSRLLQCTYAYVLHVSRACLNDFVYSSNWLRTLQALLPLNLSASESFESLFLYRVALILLLSPFLLQKKTEILLHSIRFDLIGWQSSVFMLTGGQCKHARRGEGETTK